MKRILLLLSVVGLSNIAFAQYMSKEEVLKEYQKTKTTEAIKASPLTNEAKLRQQNLIPLSVFFDKKEQVIPQKLIKAIEIKSEIDLRNRDSSPIKSQDNGKCTAFSGVAIMENLLNRNGNKPGLNLSEWHAWSKYNQYSCSAFINAITQNYICDEKDFKQYGKETIQCTKGAYVKIKSQQYIGDNIEAMKAALSQGNPVYIGMSTPNSMLNCDKVINPNNGAANGGHALAVVGYYTQGTETFGIFKNSWGSNCGDKGYNYVPMSICKQKGFYCQMWEISEVETIKPNTDPVCKQYKRLWYTLGIKKVCVLWQ